MVGGTLGLPVRHRCLFTLCSDNVLLHSLISGDFRNNAGERQREGKEHTTHTHTHTHIATMVSPQWSVDLLSILEQTLLINEKNQTYLTDWYSLVKTCYF
jgi:hypothetical protein